MSEKIAFTECVDLVGSAVKKYDGSKFYVSTGALDCDHIDFSQVDDVTYQDKPSRANLAAETGDILFAKMQGTKKTIVLDETTSGYIYSTGFAAVRAKPDMISERCLYHLITSIDFLRQKDKNCSGATQKAITNSGLKKIKISVPDVREQPDIADRLDRLDAVMQSCKQMLERFDDIVKSRFVEMFGDPVDNPKGYLLKPLSEYIDFLTSGSRGWAKYCVDEGTEWFITIKNVKNCRITTDNMQPVNAPQCAEAERTRVQEGDLLISITADLGRTGVVSKEIAEHGAYINQHLSCVRLKKKDLLPLYVAYFMESPAGKRQFFSKNQSAVKAGLNFDSIRTLQVLIPPISLQEDFAAFVEEVDKSKLVCTLLASTIETN